MFADMCNYGVADQDQDTWEAVTNPIFSTFEDSTYQNKAQGLLKVLNAMRDAGAQMEVDLPTIVVCGDQSVGKSSLIEAICAVNLPRNAGTCTRCPMEVRMSEERPSDDNAWSCKVKLRREFDDKRQVALTKTEEDEFAEVFHKSEVERVVHLAQMALLNPSKEAEYYNSKVQQTASDGVTEANDASEADSSEEPASELMFTRNVVIVEIKGAPVNLTLIDLPGIIRSVEKSADKQNIELIHGLVEHYIRADNAIIVAVVACTTDVENQEIIQMAKEADPTGRRTVGVLTKPDRIEEAAEQKWVDVLKGQHHSLQLGYYMIRNPGQKELKSANLTFEVARQLEMRFFTRTKPWSDLQHELPRFGVQQLRQELSRQLVSLMDEKLPGIRSDLKSKLFVAMSELEKLPLPVLDPSLELLNILNAFVAEVKANVTAQGDAKQFVQALEKCNTDLYKAIMSNRPSFKFGSQTVSQDEEGTVSSAGITLSKEAVQKLINDSRGDELPNYHSFNAVRSVVQTFQAKWQEEVGQCFANSLEAFSGMLDTASKKCAGRFPQLEALLRNHAHACAAQIAKQAEHKVAELLQRELKLVYTINHHYYSDSYDRMLGTLKKVIQPCYLDSALQAGSHAQKYANEALANLSHLGISGLKIEDLTRLLALNGDDEQVCTVMASAMAYYKVASKRFVDAVALALKCDVFMAYSDDISAYLMKELNVMEAGQNQGVARLIREEQGIAAKRQALQAQRDRLQNVQDRLSEVMRMF